MATTEIYLLRHARSAPSPDHIPAWDWPLAKEGSAQARRLADRLATLGIDHVYSSPRRRTIETIEPFTRAAGLGLRVHQDLREAEGIEIWVDDFAAHVKRLWDDFDLSIDDLESHRQCQRRMVRAVTELASEHAEETVLCSSHGQAIALFLNHVESTFGYEEWAAMRMPDLRKVTWDGERFSWDESVAGPWRGLKN